MLPAQYVTYDGSLTTPSCYETVFWTVILNPIRIDSKQVNLLSRVASKNCPRMLNIVVKKI